MENVVKDATQTIKTTLKHLTILKLMEKYNSTMVLALSVCVIYKRRKRWDGDGNANLQVGNLNFYI